MADPVQNYKNHPRLFPLFHYFAVPVLLLNVINALRHIYLTPNRSTIFAAVVAAAILGAALSARVMALTVQNRVIRLEMRLRLRGLLPPDLHPRIFDLSPGQLVALRFASDDELPDLVRDILDGKLSAQKDIKLRVKNWQSDFLRA
jgi:hypothetical protein